VTEFGSPQSGAAFTVDCVSGRVFKRGKTWSYVIDVGRGCQEWRQQMRGGFATKRAAQQALRDIARSIDEGTFVVPSHETISTFLVHHWLPAMRPTLRGTAWVEYRRKINVHVVPRLGDLPLQSLTAGHLNSFYADLLASGRADGQPELSEPKTNRSGRVIDLDERTVAALRTWRSRQADHRREVGAAWHDLDLVVTREDGLWLHPDWFSELFRRRVALLGLPPIRLHDLRHPHATLLLQAGVNPKVVSERLGHHSVAFTLDTYAHVVPGMQSDAVRRLSQLIDAATPPQRPPSEPQTEREQDRGAGGPDLV
jgi:hypothetical protein